MDKSNFWLIVISLGAGTLLIRSSFFFLYSYIHIPHRVKRAFGFIPAAILPALVIPSVFFHQGQIEILSGNERLVALFIATIVSYKTNSVLMTVVAGIASLFLLTSLL